MERGGLGARHDVADAYGALDGAHQGTRDQLERMDDRTLDETVGRVNVYARVSPEHKLRLIRALQARGLLPGWRGESILIYGAREAEPHFAVERALVQATGSSTAVSVYLLIMTLVSMGAVLVLRDRPGIDLSINNQAEQEVGATIFDKRRGASTDDVDVVKTTV